MQVVKTWFSRATSAEDFFLNSWVLGCLGDPRLLSAFRVYYA